MSSSGLYTTSVHVAVYVYLSFVSIKLSVPVISQSPCSLQIIVCHCFKKAGKELIRYHHCLQPSETIKTEEPSIPVSFPQQNLSFHLSLNGMDFVWLGKWGEEEIPSHSMPERSAFLRDSTMSRKMLLNGTGWHNVQRWAPPQLPAVRISTMEYLFQDKQLWVLLDNGFTDPPPRYVARVGKCGQERKGRTRLRGNWVCKLLSFSLEKDLSQFESCFPAQAGCHFPLSHSFWQVRVM